MCYAWVYYAVAAVASVVSYRGAQITAAGQENVARYNAEIATQQATVAREQRPAIEEDADLERRRLADRYGQIAGDAQASFAAQGLDPNAGTPFAVVEASRQAFDIDKEIISKNERDSLRANDLEAHGLMSSAELLRTQGRYARQGGNLEAWGALLTGASNISNRWSLDHTGPG